MITETLTDDDGDIDVNVNLEIEDDIEHYSFPFFPLRLREFWILPTLTSCSMC